MSYSRLSLAAVGATVVDLIYGFVVYGNALSGETSMYGAMFRRPDEINANLPWLIVGLLIAMFAAASLYARSHGDGTSIAEGLRFGTAIGLLCVGYVGIGNYVVMRMGNRLALVMAAAGFVEWLVAGVVIGLIYTRHRTTHKPPHEPRSPST